MPQRGTTQDLDVTFYEGPGGAIVDPKPGTVTLQVMYDGVVVFTANPAEIVKDSVGHYTYDWNIPLNATPGLYVVVWGAVMPNESTPSYGYQNVTVTATAPGLPNFAGCVWPIDPGCLGAAWNGYDEDVQQRAVSLASATLSRLTGGQVGDCPVTVRPDVQRGCCLPPGPLDYSVTRYGITGILGRCHDPREIELPAPIYRVDEVRVDGVVVNPADYKVFDQRVLRYTGAALTAWPVAQDWNADDDQVGYFSVTYLNTAPVDAQGAYAAGLLAAEFAKACTGGTGCKFPKNVTSIVRSGVAIEIASGAFPDGNTGIREVDAYVAQWGKGGRTGATLIDPGAPQHRVVTG